MRKIHPGYIRTYDEANWTICRHSIDKFQTSYKYGIGPLKG